VRRLDPLKEPGRLSLITRYGSDKVRKQECQYTCRFIGVLRTSRLSTAWSVMCVQLLRLDGRMLSGCVTRCTETRKQTVKGRSFAHARGSGRCVPLEEHRVET
jgi:hypothetical protein